jgi:hypothetical protein
LKKIAITSPEGSNLDFGVKNIKKKNTKTGKEYKRTTKKMRAGLLKQKLEKWYFKAKITIFQIKGERTEPC